MLGIAPVHARDASPARSSALIVGVPFPPVIARSGGPDGLLVVALEMGVDLSHSYLAPTSLVRIAVAHPIALRPLAFAWFPLASGHRDKDPIVFKPKAYAP